VNLDWHARAACRDHPDPDMWFPGPGASSRAQAAGEICRSCPVQIECARYAADAGEQFGIWGGRSGFLPVSTIRKWDHLTLRPCGTEAAYVRHLRRSERPCQACRDAHSSALRDRRKQSNGSNT